MWGLFPFFYYDILARVIPGAFTLAVILRLARHDVASRWINIFAGGETWKAVVVPLVLGGLSYVIGVMYEVLDSCPWLEKYREYRPREFLDNRAFEAAWDRFTHTYTPPTDLGRLEKFHKEERWRTHLWERLVYEAARKDDMVSVFWHCHRFQGEYKLFYHLILPTLILGLVSPFQGHIYTGIVATVLTLFFILGAFRRDERRLWQLLSFAEQLDWLKDYYTYEAAEAEPLQRAE